MIERTRTRIDLVRAVFAVFAVSAALVRALGPLSAGAADAPRIEAAIDSANITVGSPAQLVVRVHAPPGSEVGAVTLVGDPGEVVVRESIPFPPASGAGADDVVHETRFTLTAYATGTFPVPPAVAVVTRAGGGTDTLRSDTLRLSVASVLPAAADSAKLRDIKGLQRLPGSVFPWRATLIALAAVALAIAGYLLLRRHRRRPRLAPAAPVVPAVPPHILARRALEELRAQGFHLRGLMDEFYTSLTGIMRMYLGSRFGFTAIDMTTSEILAALEARQARGILTAEVVSLSHRLLDEADLVKFARGRPAVEAAEKAFEMAERLLSMTEPVTTPVTVSAAQGHGVTDAQAASMGGA